MICWTAFFLNRIFLYHSHLLYLMGFWRSFTKEWFAFSRSERQGIWILIVVVVSAVVVARLYPEPATTAADPDLVAEANRINALIEDDSSDSFVEAFKSTKESPSVALSLFSFDPNAVTKEQLQQMGIPETAIKSLLGYRGKGGVFRKPEDIQKLYGITPELASKLIPFMAIPDSLRRKEFTSMFAAKNDTLQYAKRFPVEINGADSISLLLLKGIGPTLAHKIITYRSRLGGFYNSNQLLDIYGVREETILQMKDQFVIDTTIVVRWSVNTLPPDSMAKHPYLSKYQANAIAFYRGKVGRIRSLDELVRNRIIPPEVAKRLRPYVKF